jgi:hypothetical protein
VGAGARQRVCDGVVAGGEGEGVQGGLEGGGGGSGEAGLEGIRVWVGMGCLERGVGVRGGGGTPMICRPGGGACLGARGLDIVRDGWVKEAMRGGSHVLKYLGACVVS